MAIVIHCNLDECDRICRRDFQPVCSNQGKTYSNLCEFDKANCQEGNSLFIAKNTACDAEISDLRTDQGKMILIFAKCFQLDLFLFPYTDLCDLKCTREFKLLCGSNSKTYNNECLKKEDECRTGSSIGVVKRGPCSDSSVVFASPEPEGKSFIKRDLPFRSLIQLIL